MLAQRWILCGLVVAAVVVAGVADADEGVVEATGEANVEGGDAAGARTRAIADALKHCVEKVVGVSIRSDFSAKQREIVENNRSTFSSRVQDALVQHSEGFVQTYEVLRQDVVGGTMRVWVRAQVFASRVKAELAKLTDLIAAAGNPTLMLAIQEVYIDDAGQRVVADSTAASHLEKELIARGFSLKGAGSARAITAASVAEYDAWLAAPGRMAAAAQAVAADMLIAGRIEIRDRGGISAADAGGLSALVGQVRVEISAVVRGVNVATGEVFSAKPVQMKSMGTSVERAVYRAFRGRGQNAVAQLLEGLLADLQASLQKAATRGQAYVVKLQGVGSFRRQGRGFIALLREVAGVSEVQQQGYTRGELGGELVLRVRCNCAVSQLQERIFRAAEGHKAFGTLDVVGTSGKQLSFGL